MTNFLKVLGGISLGLIAVLVLLLIAQSSTQLSAQTPEPTPEELIEQGPVVEQPIEEFVIEDRVEDENIVIMQEEQATETLIETEVEESTPFWGNMWLWFIGIFMIVLLVVFVSRREKTY